MADYTGKRFDAMEPILGGFFVRARTALGTSSFGMQILRFGCIMEDDGALGGRDAAQDQTRATLTAPARALRHHAAIAGQSSRTRGVL